MLQRARILTGDFGSDVRNVGQENLLEAIACADESFDQPRDRKTIEREFNGLRPAAPGFSAV